MAGAFELDVALDASAEEELAVPGRFNLTPVLAALLVVAGMAALLLHRPDGSIPPIRAAPSVPTVLPASPVAARQLSCPGRTVCSTTHTVPRPFLAAVRTLLPEIATHRAVSIRLRRAGTGGLYLRLYDGRDGPAAISVLVQRDEDVLADAVDPPAEANRIVVRGRQRVGVFVVDVRISAPAAVAPSRAQVNELARDPRLVVAA